MYNQQPHAYYYNTGTHGYTQHSRGHERGGYHNNVKKIQKEEYEENGNTNVSNRDVKPRGHFKRGSYDNQKRQDKRHESEN